MSAPLSQQSFLFDLDLDFESPTQAIQTRTLPEPIESMNTTPLVGFPTKTPIQMTELIELIELTELTELTETTNSDPASDPIFKTKTTEITATISEAQDEAPAVTSDPAVFTPDIMLVDIAGLAYAALYSPQGKLSHEGFTTGCIHGAMSSLFARMAQRPGAVPVVLWDAKATWRHQMFPGYKASRSGIPAEAEDGTRREPTEAELLRQEFRTSYRMQAPYIRLLLTLMGIPQVSCGESEADDLAGAICRELDPSWSIEMVSRDTDWWQQLDERTVWYSPVHKKGLTLAGLADPNNGMKDGHFLSTNEYLEAKALAGDASDEIPGIVGVGLLTACKIIRQHGTSIRDFWAKVDSGEIKPKGVVMTRMADAESRAIFERNVKLMDWREAPALELWALAVTAGWPNFEMLEAEAACLGLKKLVANAKEKLKPWKDGWGPGLDAVSAAIHHRECRPVVRPAF